MSNSTSNNYHHTTKNLSHRSNPCMQFRFWQLAIIIIMRLYYIYIAKRVREAPFNRHPPPPKRTSWMALKISRFRGAWRSYTSQYLQQLLRSFEWVNFSCPERNGETVALEGPLLSISSVHCHYQHYYHWHNPLKHVPGLRRKQFLPSLSPSPIIIISFAFEFNFHGNLCWVTHTHTGCAIWL